MIGPTDVTTCKRLGDSARSITLALLLILAVCAISAVWTTAAATWFSFALRAIAKAGENPPVSVAHTLESQVQLQEYANAALVGASLALVLRTASLLLSVLFPAGDDISAFSDMILLVGASVVGGLAMSAACFAFRCQPVGSQDLVLASAIHAGLWGTFGALLVRRNDLPRVGFQKVQSCIVAGTMWGLVYICAIVFLMPGEYVERLFSTNAAVVGLWAGGGSGCLLGAFAFFRKDSPTTKLALAPVNAEQFVAKG